MRMSQMARGPLPELMGALSGAVESVYQKNLFQPEKIAGIADIVEFILSQDTNTLANLAELLGAFIAAEANNAELYSSANATSLPSMQLFKNCDLGNAAFAEAAALGH